MENVSVATGESPWLLSDRDRLLDDAEATLSEFPDEMIDALSTRRRCVSAVA